MTGLQGMLTPSSPLIPPLVYAEVRVFLYYLFCIDEIDQCRHLDHYLKTIPDKEYSGRERYKAVIFRALPTVPDQWILLSLSLMATQFLFRSIYLLQYQVRVSQCLHNYLLCQYNKRWYRYWRYDCCIKKIKVHTQYPRHVATKGQFY